MALAINSSDEEEKIPNPSFCLSDFVCLIFLIFTFSPNFFLKKELFLRKEKKLPPFYRLISLIISGKDEQLIMKFATTIKSKLPKLNNVNILGPVLAPITKLRKKYRCRILIRCPKNLFIQKYLSLSLDKIKMTSGIKLEVDVDPINFS